MKANRPSIFQIGKVFERDGSTVITGWGLGLCITRCACHRHPNNGHLYIAEDQELGLVGLRSFTFDGTCNCCLPWTADELRDMGEALRDWSAEAVA